MAPPALKQRKTPEERIRDLEAALQQEQKDRVRDRDRALLAELRLNTKINAVAKFGQIEMDVHTKHGDLRTAADRIGLAYSTAAGNHTDAVAKATKRGENLTALETQVMFSLLTIASAGGFSWMMEVSVMGMEARAAEQLETKVMELATRPYKTPRQGARLAQQAENIKNRFTRQGELRKLWTTFAKDTVVAALGEGFSAVGPGLDALLDSHPPTPSKPVNIDPLKFQDTLVVQLDALRDNANLFLDNMIAEINKLPDEAWDYYDKNEFQTKYQNWLKDAAKFSGNNDLPRDDNQMAEDLEKLFWAEWIHGLRRTNPNYGKCYGGGQGACDPTEAFYDRVYQEVDDRFVALKIETQEQTDLRPEREYQVLIAWADDYLKNVKPWVKDLTRRATAR